MDVVTFVPAGRPWQKAADAVTPLFHRMAMLEAAVAGVPYFEVDDREAERAGPSYTIDTLNSYSREDELWLILGADAAKGISSWHRSTDVLARAKLAVAMRPGVVKEEVEAVAGASVTWLDTPQLFLSGSDIRRRVRLGESVRFLVPDPVWTYIETEGLYG